MKYRLGRPATQHGKKMIERMREMLTKPAMTNLERAHMILAQDAPNMITREWAEEYANRHTKGTT